MQKGHITIQHPQLFSFTGGSSTVMGRVRALAETVVVDADCTVGMVLYRSVPLVPGRAMGSGVFAFRSGGGAGGSWGVSGGGAGAGAGAGDGDGDGIGESLWTARGENSLS